MLCMPVALRLCRSSSSPVVAIVGFVRRVEGINLGVARVRQAQCASLLRQLAALPMHACTPRKTQSHARLGGPLGAALTMHASVGMLAWCSLP